MVDDNRDIVMFPDNSIKDKFPKPVFARIATGEPEGDNWPIFATLFYNDAPYVPIWAKPLSGTYEDYMTDYRTFTEAGINALNTMLREVASSQCLLAVPQPVNFVFPICINNTGDSRADALEELRTMLTPGPMHKPEDYIMKYCYDTLGNRPTDTLEFLLSNKNLRTEYFDSVPESLAIRLDKAFGGDIDAIRNFCRNELAPYVLDSINETIYKVESAHLDGSLHLCHACIKGEMFDCLIEKAKADMEQDVPEEL